MVPFWCNTGFDYDGRNGYGIHEQAVRIRGGKTPDAKLIDYSNTKELGLLIYTEYVYAFELAAVILLVAMIAAIAITLRYRTDKNLLMYPGRWQLAAMNG